MEKNERDAGGLLATQIESLLLRGGFKIKKNAVFKVKERPELVPLIAVSHAGTEIIVECDEVGSETNEFVKPLLERLLDKKARFGVEKILLVTTPKHATKPGFDHVLGVLTYATQGVYYWDSYELKRLSSLKDAELKAELIKNLKLVFLKDVDGVFRAGEAKEASAHDPDSIESTVKDVLSAAPPLSPRYQSGPTAADASEEQETKALLSDNLFIILIAVVVLCLLVGLFFFWQTLEEFLKGAANVMGLIVLILVAIGLSLYSTD